MEVNDLLLGSVTDFSLINISERSAKFILAAGLDKAVGLVQL